MAVLPFLLEFLLSLPSCFPSNDTNNNPPPSTSLAPLPPLENPIRFTIRGVSRLLGSRSKNHAFSLGLVQMTPPLPTPPSKCMAYCLVHLTPLGFKGASLALSISLWISVLKLGSYVIHAKKLKHTWTGFSCESFSYVLVNLKLALPSAGMVCLEHWAFEILVLLAGLMPNSQITTPLLAMCVSTSSVAYMLTYGLSAAASTRVSNELGAGKVDRAKNAMVVTLKLSVFVAIVAIEALGFGRNAWAGLFNNGIIIKKEFASMVPFLAASIAVDAVQGVLLGLFHNSYKKKESW